MWNISNLLSLIRLIMAFPVCFFVYSGKNNIVLILGFIAILTDYFDGYFARKLNQITELGKILDPLADKVLVVSIVIILISSGQFPLWLGWTIIIRDILILTGGIIAKKKFGIVQPSLMSGKIAVTGIAFLIISILVNFNLMITYGVYLVLLTLIWSFTEYVIRFYHSYRKIH